MKPYYALLIIANAIFIPLLMLHAKTRRSLQSTPGLWLAPLVCLPFFFIWDVIGVAAGWWQFDHNYIIGLQVFHVPVEELLFLYLIPLATLFIWMPLRRRQGSK